MLRGMNKSFNLLICFHRQNGKLLEHIFPEKENFIDLSCLSGLSDEERFCVGCECFEIEGEMVGGEMWDRKSLVFCFCNEVL
jgi:hypothetical protein